MADAPNDSAPIQVGKRFKSPTSGVEVLVTKGGTGQLSLNGEPMELVEPKQTASAD